MKRILTVLLAAALLLALTLPALADEHAAEWLAEYYGFGITFSEEVTLEEVNTALGALGAEPIEAESLTLADVCEAAVKLAVPDEVDAHTPAPNELDAQEVSSTGANGEAGAVLSMGAAFGSADVQPPSSESPDERPTIAHGQVVALDGLILHAPVDGQLVSQKTIDDKAFREGFLGSCFGIIPSSGAVFAPCDGTVELVTDTHHAYVIKTPQGDRALVHVGLGTVNMQGAGFEPLVAVGDPVVVGQPLLNVDLDLVRSSGHQDMVITALPQDA